MPRFEFATTLWEGSVQHNMSQTPLTKLNTEYLDQAYSDWVDVAVQISHISVTIMGDM